MAIFTYSAPVVGGSENTWGTTLNQNWADLSTFLGSLDSAELAVLDGITATTAELNLLDGVTATTAEINLLDGVTATTAEINYVSGVTSAIQTQIDGIAPTLPGTVIQFAGSSAPSGYLKADGSAISRTAYAALFAAIGTTHGSGDGSTTFNLPDLRGEFVRGWDDGRGVDSGRGFGSAQSDEFKSHNHTLTAKSFTTGPGAGWRDVTTSNATNATSFTGGSETRPRNIALLYCIKT